MQIFNNLNTDNQGLSLALGFFDGIHLGHKAVIKNAVDYAKKNNSKSAVITFQEHPLCILYNLKPQYIISRSEKIRQLENLGVDYIYFLNFDEHIAKMTGENYLKEIIIKNFSPIAISTGFNHRFGCDKTADADFLKEKQKEFNYKYFEIPPVKLDDIIISSTEIRKLLSVGEISKVNSMLGFNLSVENIVKHGRELGRKLGYPTANLDYPTSLLPIKFGVYEVVVEYKKITYKGIANYGCKPSIEQNSSPILEVHILDFSDMIYNEKIKVSFINKIRDEQKFNSLEELKNQIEKDIQQVK